VSVPISIIVLDCVLLPSHEFWKLSLPIESIVVLPSQLFPQALGLDSYLMWPQTFLFICNKNFFDQILPQSN